MENFLFQHPESGEYGILESYEDHDHGDHDGEEHGEEEHEEDEHHDE